MGLDPDVLVPRIAAMGDQYRENNLLPGLRRLTGCSGSDRTAFRDALSTPVVSARVMFGYFVFERAGAGRAGYDRICTELLDSDGQWIDGVAFWTAFEQECKRLGKGPNARNNKGPVTQVFRRNLIGESQGWLYRLGRDIADTGRVAPSFVELCTVTGISHKIAAFICRDLTWLFDCEAILQMSEQVLLQPVDTWVRQMAACLWPSLKAVEDQVADPAVAVAMTTGAQESGVSGISLNQGAWLLGYESGELHKDLMEVLANLQAIE